MNNWYDCIGVFVEECSNRFISLVSLNGEIVEAYVQCSCRLDNFIDLKGKNVYLKVIKKPKRAKYLIVAVKYGNSCIILSPKCANDMFFTYLKNKTGSYFGKRKKVIKEFYVHNYKADYYILDTNTVIEVKSLLSLEKEALFPTVYSERALVQLDCIEKLLREGYKCYYEIIAINPYVKGIILDTTNSILAKRINELTNYGLIVEFKKVSLRNNKWSIRKIK